MVIGSETYGNVLLLFLEHCHKTGKQPAALSKLAEKLLNSKELGDISSWTPFSLLCILRSIGDVALSEEYEKQVGKLLQQGMRKLPKKWLLAFSRDLHRVKGLSNFKEILNEYSEALHKHKEDIYKPEFEKISQLIAKLK